MFFTETRTFTPAQIKKAKALKTQAQKKLDTMEYGNVTLKRVKNLSHADVEEIVDNMTRLVNTGKDPYANKLSPSSEIQEVYENAGVF